MATQISFTDILTTSASVASYLGAAHVAPEHVQHAIALLLEETVLEDIGRPLPPLVPRPAPGPATPGVRHLAQRWISGLGSDPARTLTGSELRSIRDEISALIDGAESPAIG
ncbi:MAG: hypothetical protein AB7T37_04620 [Dehalococcoidia bacterium]